MTYLLLIEKTGDIKDRPKYNIIANDFIYPEHINALLPGDVVLNLQNPNVGGSKLLNDDNSVNIQSFDINIPLDREDLYRLGSRYVCDRKLKFPQVANVSFTLIVDQLLQGETHNMFANDKKYDFNLNLKRNLLSLMCVPDIVLILKKKGSLISLSYLNQLGAANALTQCRLKGVSL